MAAVVAASSSVSSAFTLCSQCLVCPAPLVIPAVSPPLCSTCVNWLISTAIPGFPGRGMVARRALVPDELIFEDTVGLAADVPEDVEKAEDDGAAGPSSGPASASAFAPATVAFASAYVSLLRDLIRFSADATAADDADSESERVLGAAFRHWTNELCAMPEPEFAESSAGDGALSGENLIRAAKRLFVEMMPVAAAAGAVDVAAAALASVTLAAASASSASAAPSPTSPLLLRGSPFCERDFVLGMIRVKLNCWRLETDSAARRLIVPLCVAAINHSCAPNAVLVNGSQVYAARPIAAGEQICMSYLPPADLLATTETAERRRLLSRTWHFDCQCPRCADPESADKQWNAELEEAWIFHGFHPEFEAVCVEDDGEAAEGDEAEEEDDQEA